MITSLAIALVGTVVTAAGGCLLGLLMGHRARRALAVDNERLRELASRAPAPGEGEAQVDKLREELEHTLRSLLAREQDEVRESVHEAVRPLMVHERRARGLRSLVAPAQGRRRLPELLDMIARRGAFCGVLLSDERGLPLAASTNAHDAEALAGISSLILAFADRVSQAQSPRPTAVLVRDAENQLVLHRMFDVAGERFLITAVSKGGEVSIDGIDPALAALEGALAPQLDQGCAPPLSA